MLFLAVQIYLPASTLVTMVILKELFIRTLLEPKDGKDWCVNLTPLGVVHSTEGKGSPSVEQWN